MQQTNWLVHGNFFGFGNDATETLYETKEGAVVLSFGPSQHETVGGLGPEWSLRGVGDYLGDGKDQVLIENNHGWLVVGEVNPAGVMTYKSLGGLGSEWHFLGTSDYLHNGHDTFLIENAAGHTAVGDAAALTWGAEYTWLS
jgi:hypothetical protein